MLRTSVGVLTSAVLACPGLARAGSEVRFMEARILCTVEVRVPDAPGERTPLVVALHGRGGAAASMLPIWDVLQDPKPVFVAPDAPYSVLLAGAQPEVGRSWALLSANRELWRRADPAVVDYVLDVLRDARSRHASGRVYLLGYSQGAAYAYRAAAREPQLIDGVIALAGILPTDVLPEDSLARAAGRVRVFIGHGLQDQAVSIEQSRRARDTLTRLGFAVTHREFEGGHGLNRDILLQAQAWMMRSEKEDETTGSIQ
jgi:phospholipase/carboxylesterase